MTGQQRTLTNHQRLELYKALTLRNAEFIDVCEEVLGATGKRQSHLHGEIYDGLATGKCSKLEALDTLLEQSGFARLRDRRQFGEDQYDIETLLNFAADDHPRFISMIVDLIASRPPSHDEALQFEQLLHSSKMSRRDVMDSLISRYPDRFEVVSQDVLQALHASDFVLLETDDGGGMKLHPVMHMNGREQADTQLTHSETSTLISGELMMHHRGDWSIQYDVSAHSGDALQIEVREGENEAPIIAVSALHHLKGGQYFEVRNSPTSLHIVLKSKAAASEIEPRFMRVQLVSCA